MSPSAAHRRAQPWIRGGKRLGFACDGSGRARPRRAFRGTPRRDDFECLEEYHPPPKCTRTKKAPRAIQRSGPSIWRRDRDLNPRYCCQYNGFRIRPVRPLRHLSNGAHHTSDFVSGKSFLKKIRVVSGACVNAPLTAARPGAWPLLHRLRSRRPGPGGSGPCPSSCGSLCPTGGSRPG